MYNFFISYAKKDIEWANWIAWILEKKGYSVILQEWDFIAGKNFVLQMDIAARESEKTIAILSTAYMSSVFTPSEWAAAFAEDPMGKTSKLIPIRIEECKLDGLLKQISYIDLVGISNEEEAKKLIEDRVGGRRLKPSVAPPFPNDAKKK